MNLIRSSRILLVAAVVFAACSAPPEKPLPEFDATHVAADVVTQCAFGPRLPGSAARDSVAAMLARRLKSCGAEVRAQAFDQKDPWQDGSFRLINIIASFEPDRPRRVMLASHYDTRPWADDEPDSTLHDRPIPGAVDGATSSAILLEIGRLMSVRMPEDIGVDLVFFDGEDYGHPDDYAGYCLGSKYFAANLSGYRPVCAMVLDLVGGDGTQIARETWSVQNSKALVDTVFARAVAMGLGSFLDVNAGPVFDDHVPLLQAGVNTMNLFGYDYPYWHKLTDTPDKVDKERVSEVGRLLVNFLYDFPF